ncbi:MAG TPA: universal stress protein [Xanthobacteraceae bacterium]|jgi:nucleotide-binding universal stress UspA family protein
MIKDVVVNLSLGTDRDPACEYAISLAQACNAHITGIAFAYDPLLAAPAGGWEVMPPYWIEEQRAKSAEVAGVAVTSFEQGARRLGVGAQSHVITAGAAEAAERFGRIGRRFDLSILQQNEPGKPSYQDLLIEAALFDSGRPLLIVPYIQTAGFSLDHVLVCWDASRNAARAIGDAVPMLARAKAIEVVTIGSGSDTEEIPGFDIAHHLARHGLKVELKSIVAPDLDVSSSILSHAADVSADFIVMGGYGHSRMREFILGGATRGLLASMTIPTFMSH